MGHPPQEAAFVAGCLARAHDAVNERPAEGKMDRTLFPLPEAEGGPQAEESAGPPRLKRANRAQLRLVPMDLESSLPEEHAARVIWEFVEQLDLRPLYAPIRAVEGHPGQNAIEPKILMAVRLFRLSA